MLECESDRGASAKHPFSVLEEQVISAPILLEYIEPLFNGVIDGAIRREKDKFSALRLNKGLELLEPRFVYLAVVQDKDRIV